MISKPELERVSPHVAVWHAYDATVKSELWSTLLQHDNGAIVIDPIEIRDEESKSFGPVGAVIVTNANHERASAGFGAPILSAASPRDPETLKVQLIDIPGAAENEIAVYSPLDGGTLVIGDALINFEPYGFTFLPAKYCTDQKLMRRSLLQLQHLDFARILFAHGTPITSRAKERLAALVES